MPRYRLTVAYDGTNFHGWQKQHPPVGEPLRTVQEVLEQAVRHVVREDVQVDGASRTDSGVHAMGQIAAFTTMREIAQPSLLAAINARLPADVLVREICMVRETFEPIAACTRKAYRYTVQFGSPRVVMRPLFDRFFVARSPYELHVEDMQQAAQHLVGEHDFASFTRVQHGKESTVRRIDACSVIRDPIHAHRLQIEVIGPGFLYNMVRIIAGTLIEVGRGKFQPDDVTTILAARDRSAAGPTMPPEGLCLLWIEYPPDTVLAGDARGAAGMECG